MNFNLKKPCKHCPFRSDIAPFITAARAKEICSSIMSGLSFTCHKTLDYSHDDGDGESEGRTTKKTEMCAGAMILLEKVNRPNQMMRIAERLGMYDHTKLDMSQPVYDSPEAMIAAHRRKTRA